MDYILMMHYVIAKLGGQLQRMTEIPGFKILLDDHPVNPIQSEGYIF
jgi:hypothetical protein